MLHVQSYLRAEAMQFFFESIGALDQQIAFVRCARTLAILINDRPRDLGSGDMGRVAICVSRRSR